METIRVVANFELFEKRAYRRVSIMGDDGVYCIVGSPPPEKKTITVSAVEFSQKGFQFAIPSKVEYFKNDKLLLKAIAGSRNLTFAEPIAFEIMWKNFDVKKEMNYFGCRICDISDESEEQFVSFIQKELKFNGIWGQGKHGESVNGTCEDKDQYKGLFHNSHTVMLMIDPKSGNIIDANPAAIAYYGWSYKELTNKTISDINTLTEEQVHQEMKNAKKQNRRHFIFEHCMANGAIRPVEVYSGPINLNGKQISFSIVHDIAEKKKAERDREKLLVELKKAINEIKSLQKDIANLIFLQKDLR